MNFTLDSSCVRGAMASADLAIARGGGVGDSKKSFGQKLGGCGREQDALRDLLLMGWRFMSTR